MRLVNALARAAAILVCVLLPAALGAVEVREGRIKLVLHEGTGRFSLYYLTDIKRERYESLFVDQDPRTSFLSLLVDDKTFRLGESTAFRFRLSAEGAKPAIVFDSSFLSVSQEFSFIKSEGAALADGVRIDVRISNRGERQTQVGVRFLLDTKLGEGSPVHFSTDQRELRAETVISGTDSDRWWYSKSESAGLMGSISVEGASRPNAVHIANWKRLNDAPWKVSPSQGRNFNLLPFSVGDSALCYYFDPAPLARGGESVVSILLAAARDGGFGAPSVPAEDDVSRILRESAAAAASPELIIRTDLIALRDILDRIDRALAAGGTATEDELAAMEAILERMKGRHGAR